MSASKYEVVVHEPRDVPGKIIKGKSIFQSLTGNTYYPVADPPLLEFEEDIKNALDSEAGTKTKPPKNTIKERDGFVGKMDKDIESYRLACQSLVNDPANAEVVEQIAESFDMELKTHTARGERKDEILDGKTPNSVFYRMKGTGPHEVEMSLDGGKTIIPLSSTRKGEKDIGGLTLLVTISLRNRQVLAHDKYSDWTNWLPFTPTK